MKKLAAAACMVVVVLAARVAHAQQVKDAAAARADIQKAWGFTPGFIKAFPDSDRSRIGILISDEVGNDANATQRSLDLLAYVKGRSPQTVTKSGLMLGLGETAEELFDVLADLRDAGCDTLTLGQYLAPTLKHIPVVRYVPPREFDELAALARTLGFRKVVAGPFVRSSYRAEEALLAASHPVIPRPGGPRNLG